MCDTGVLKIMSHANVEKEQKWLNAVYVRS